MKRYLFYLLTSIITFVISIFFVTVWIYDLFSRDFDEVKQPQYLKVEFAEVTFNDEMRVLTSNGCYDVWTSSEGKTVSSRGYEYDTKQQADYALSTLLKDAKIIFISTSDKPEDAVKERVIIEKNGAIKILTLSEYDEKTSEQSYLLHEIESADFKTAIDFENRKDVVQEQFLRLND